MEEVRRHVSRSRSLNIDAEQVIQVEDTLEVEVEVAHMAVCASFLGLRRKLIFSTEGGGGGRGGGGGYASYNQGYSNQQRTCFFVLF